MNFLRPACTAVYRVSALALLLIVTAELARTNQLLFAIGSMLFKAIGGGVS